jgi:Mrp family chromosome partitioning ATPase
VVHVLTAGLATHSDEFVGTPALAQLLKDLGKHADLVLIDGPPMLSVSDGVTLSSEVDGIIVVARLETARRPLLAELRRVLETSTATTLGVVVTGVSGKSGHGYGSGYMPKRADSIPERLPESVA